MRNQTQHNFSTKSQMMLKLCNKKSHCNMAARRLAREVNQTNSNIFVSAMGNFKNCKNKNIFCLRRQPFHPNYHLSLQLLRESISTIGSGNLLIAGRPFNMHKSGLRQVPTRPRR